MVNGQICYREYDHIYKAVIDGVCLDKEPALCEESAKLPETCLHNFDKLCQAGQAFKDNVCSEADDNNSENNESEGNGSWSDNKEGLSDGAVAGIVVGVVIVVALVVGLLVFFLVSKKKKDVGEAAVESVIGEDAAKVVTAAV